MGTTVFCTFEQQDIADLAVGKLRNSVTGIRSIQYIRGFNAVENILNRSAFINKKQEDSVLGSVFPPQRPVMVKIVCSDASAAKVKARLINLHAYQIITTR